MAQNPLQQYFRQPKIYISLPSMGVYNKPGSISGEVSNIAIFGMTGMDEIMMKTPDALMSGESTVKVIESCCPAITDAWELSNLDADLILAAIRIATFGNIMNVDHTCPNCNTENEYALDLSNRIDHFSKCKYDNTVVLKELVVKLQPLTYRQTTAFSLRNFQLQQKLSQTAAITDEANQKKVISELFSEIGVLQTEIFAANIESVQAGDVVVGEREYINEWLRNSDKNVFDTIRLQFDANRTTWEVPAYPITCDNCGRESKLTIDLDHSNFFGNA
jgi:hypothetical protein